MSVKRLQGERLRNRSGSGAVIDLMFVLSNHGNTIHTIVSQLILLATDSS